MGGDVSMVTAAAGGRVAWIVPNYSNGRPLWRMASNAVSELVKNGQATANKTDRMVEFFNGGALGIFTADNPGGIRGEAFHLVIEDEAALIPEEVHTDVIIPTLADYDGDLMSIGTPKGINWWSREWYRAREAMNSESAAFTAPTSDNPIPNIQSAFKKIVERVLAGLYPSRTFKQEWQAEFVPDGSYFQNVDSCCTLTIPDNVSDHPGHTFCLGLDWGKSNDFTSGTIGCRECDRIVDWFKFNAIDYTTQRGRIKQYVDRWSVTRCKECEFVGYGKFETCPKGHAIPSERVEAPRVLPERNSIGEPNIEMLREMGIEIALGPDLKQGFMTTETTKPTVIEMLYIALQRGKKYPKEYAEEFRAYEVSTGPNGRPKFGAPDGMHDDCVMSAAMENYLSMSALQIF